MYNIEYSSDTFLSTLISVIKYFCDIPHLIKTWQISISFSKLSYHKHFPSICLMQLRDKIQGVAHVCTIPKSLISLGLNSPRIRFFAPLVFPKFLYPATQKVAGYYVTPSKYFECLSVRPSALCFRTLYLRRF